MKELEEAKKALELKLHDLTQQINKLSFDAKVVSSQLKKLNRLINEFNNEKDTNSTFSN